MPHYLMLIHDDDEAYAASSEEYLAKIGAQHRAFAEKHGPAVVDGRQLDSGKALVTRPDGHGKHLVTDMVFAETKEVLGGYYLVEAADLDVALGIAQEIPLGWGGRVEVWPIFVSG